MSAVFVTVATVVFNTYVVVLQGRPMGFYGLLWRENRIRHMQVINATCLRPGGSVLILRSGDPVECVVATHQELQHL